MTWAENIILHLNTRTDTLVPVLTNIHFLLLHAHIRQSPQFAPRPQMELLLLLLPSPPKHPH